MDNPNPQVFDPLDLELIDRVYEVAWEEVKTRDLFRDQNQDEERKQALRKMIFSLAPPGHVDFDALCELVLRNISQPRTRVKPPPAKRRTPRPGIGM
jgi:hypothetical protein